MHLHFPEMDQGLIINNGSSNFLSKTPGKVKIIKKEIIISAITQLDSHCSCSVSNVAEHSSIKSCKIDVNYLTGK